MTWGERTGKLTQLPSMLWMLFLLLCTTILSPNIIGWALVAFAAFLLHPKFWEGPEKIGTGPSARTILAGLFTLLMAYGAWVRIDAPMPLVGSDAKAAVAAILRDPSSAEFRNIKVGTGATCGEVNGKNAYGAYAGFKPFVYTDGVALIEPEQPAVFNVPENTAYYTFMAEFAQTQLRCYS